MSTRATYFLSTATRSRHKIDWINFEQLGWPAGRRAWMPGVTMPPQYCVACGFPKIDEFCRARTDSHPCSTVLSARPCALTLQNPPIFGTTITGEKPKLERMVFFTPIQARGKRVVKSGENGRDAVLGPARLDPRLDRPRFGRAFDEIRACQGRHFLVTSFCC